MRADQCKFCKSRNCHYRIVSSNDNGKAYDEVACWKHSHDLDKDSDIVAPKVMKIFQSMVGGTLKRGVDIQHPMHNKEQLS